MKLVKIFSVSKYTNSETYSENEDYYNASEFKYFKINGRNVVFLFGEEKITGEIFNFHKEKFVDFLTSEDENVFEITIQNEYLW